jgi:hypothetical protein
LKNLNKLKENYKSLVGGIDYSKFMKWRWRLLIFLSTKKLVAMLILIFCWNYNKLLINIIY